MVFGRMITYCVLVKVGISLLVTLSEESPPHNSIICTRELKNISFSCRNFAGIPVPVLANILSSIDTVLNKSGRVAVHCWMGMGRTGTVLGKKTHPMDYLIN